MLEPSAPLSSSAGKVRFTRLRRRIIAIGALVIAAFVALAAYDTWRSHRQSVDETSHELGSLAKTLAEQGARSFQTLDLLLRDTAQWYGERGHLLPPEAIEANLESRASGLPQLRSLAIVDKEGIQRYRSLHTISFPLDVSGRSYFAAQRDGTAKGLFVSEPITLRSTNRRTLFLSRRLNDGKGEFTGVVVAILDLDDIQQFYRAIGLGPGGAINLMREDGTLVVREPEAADAIGKQYPELAAATGMPAGVVASRIDGKPRFVAAARLPSLPLVVAVTREEAIALDTWRDLAGHIAAGTLVFAMLGVLTIVALLHQLRRVEASEQALRESEQRYALAMEGANEGHWDWDFENGHSFLSPKMKALHGRSEDSPVTTRAEWMAQVDIHPDDRLRIELAAQEHFAGHTPNYEFEYRVRHPDGAWHWLVARGRCLRGPSGKAYRFLGSAIDITSRKEAEAEKERLEAQLRQVQKMEAIGTLAGGIAHDFNNILGAILGYGELAQKHAAEGSPTRRYLDNIMHAGGRAKALVERILGFSRSALTERAPVNVQSVIEETLEMLAPALPPGVRLVKKLETGTAAVIGDPTQLHQVAMNLCTNAVHAMEGSGVLDVSLERVAVGERRPLLQGEILPGAYARLSVTDTGSGIAPAVLERMFDPFFTTKPVGEGTGLGLSLVQGIVADFGGAIDVATTVGEGTTFAVWLPISQESARTSAEVFRALPRGHGEVVMVVDDERPLVALAEEILAELGYEGVGFDSSTSALRAFRAEPKRFDLVLTDETMPELKGTELAREIRQLRPDIPIVLMSGYSGGRLAERADSAGVNDVLRKPLDSRDIAESLARALASSR